MTKYLRILFAAALVICLLCGCGNSAQTPTTSATTAAVIPTTESPVAETTLPTETVPPETQPPTTEPAVTEAPETQPPQTSASELPYLEKIPRSEQPIFAEPSYDASYVGVVQLAGVYTIVEEQTDDEDNLWGRLKSGIGWVNLTEIRHPACPISAGFGEDALLENGFLQFTLAGIQYPVSLVLRPDETVYDFRLTQVDISTGEAVLTDTLYSLEQLTPELPLLAQLEFPGDMSCFGLCFTDASGVAHRYALSMSLRNGMPHIFPVDY